MIFPLLALLIASSGSFFAANAYDSTGGAAINAMLGRVKFVEGVESAQYPKLFDWNDGTRQEFLGRFQQALSDMPLDVAQVDGVTAILASNSVCSEPEAIEKIHAALAEIDASTPEALPELYAKFRKLEGDCGLKNVHYSFESGVMSFSAPHYLGMMVRGGKARSTFPPTVLHEFVHAWELHGFGGSGFPKRTNEFYSIRFKALADDWAKSSSEIEKLASEEMERYSRLGDDEGWNRVHSGLRARIARHYERSGRPARYGGETGRCRVLGGDMTCSYKGAIDQHPLDGGTEYLAALAELIYSDPVQAMASYSKEEITWVIRNVFDGRY